MSDPEILTDEKLDEILADYSHPESVARDYVVHQLIFNIRQCRKELSDAREKAEAFEKLGDLVHKSTQVNIYADTDNVVLGVAPADFSKRPYDVTAPDLVSAIEKASKK
jgi:hypothetical protein